MVRHWLHQINLFHIFLEFFLKHVKRNSFTTVNGPVWFSSGVTVGGANGIQEFDPAVASLRMKGVRCLYGITSDAIWTSPPQLRTQKPITSQLQALRRDAVQLYMSWSWNKRADKKS